MVLNKQKGNMYGFVTHTWNPIKGKCSHDCSYCYMKVWKQKPLHLVEKELKDNLGQSNYIFVGSSTDMFAEDVPKEWIKKVLKQCRNFEGNSYLFQSKNPKRFFEFIKEFPNETTLCTTIESNRDYTGPHAPLIKDRIQAMNELDGWGYERMITIEPVMDFDLDNLVGLIEYSHADIINIGADSQNHNLPEPIKEKVKGLIKELKKTNLVLEKKNLDRLFQK